MIASQYILDILDLLLDGDGAGLEIRKQLPQLTIHNSDYSGHGVYVYFTNRQAGPGQGGNQVLDGVDIHSGRENLEAKAQLFVTDGLIQYLEIRCVKGEYPRRDLTSYTLKQVWQGSPGKVIRR